MLVLAIVAGFWISCGIFCAGASFAQFQRKFPSIAREHKVSDARFALFVGLYGPLALPIIFWVGEFPEYGWCFPSFRDLRGR